jgi:hypothetical protein
MAVILQPLQSAKRKKKLPCHFFVTEHSAAPSAAATTIPRGLQSSGEGRGSAPRRGCRARSCQRASPSTKGMARRKAQTYGSCLLAETRWRLSARHMRSSSEAVAHGICGGYGTGPCFSPPASPRMACRGVSQLLAGTPSGPGGSSDAARVPMLRPGARRRRTSSRLKNAS